VADPHPAPPALTPAEQRAFARALADAEQRTLPAAQAHLEALASRREAAPDPDEWEDANEALAFAEDRVRRLRELLARAPVIDSPPPAQARLNSRVRTRLPDGTECWYRIVLSAWEMERRPDQTDTTWGAPIARALIGRRPGEHSVIRAPSGETAITILEVRHDES
jgi:transcription elongation GreA/GreB family factor